MIVAPHPDDESLPCGVAIQRAARAGAAIRIVYVTDGENNPWPQRLFGRKWRLDHSDRRRWGQLRREETFAALALLGVSRSDAYFLALPDQGLTDLLLHDYHNTLKLLASLVADWAPTHLLFPSVFDLHSDHSALGVMFRLICKHFLPDDHSILPFSFIVHGNSPVFVELADKLEASPIETEIKLAAINCHKTQLKLAHRRFLQYADRPECFLAVAPGTGNLSDDRLCTISRNAGRLELYLRAGFKPLAFMKPRLYLIGQDESGDLLTAMMSLPRLSSSVALVNARTRRPLSLAQCRGNPVRGMTITMSPTIFSQSSEIFAKVDSRIIFFDQAGWCELPGADRAVYSKTDAATHLPNLLR